MGLNSNPFQTPLEQLNIVIKEVFTSNKLLQSNDEVDWEYIYLQEEHKALFQQINRIQGIQNINKKILFIILSMTQDEINKRNYYHPLNSLLRSIIGEQKIDIINNIGYTLPEQTRNILINILQYQEDQIL
ncbi:MAG TPA: hypothetical protein PK048_03600 [Candidatus Absconditabacterales bacterium]|nr:hypothetical protein [Candidatus Absconditabacterales bacterium]